ncbi:LRR and PYD domains-containing 3-like protein [Labeo rohita]|uniref:LRR and PYD domains-containing 3-like protein n=1 Tax=Labeo rohita TaxID=84645 RepID=A0A498L7Y5_LABRO|nr:LRR and PYD domains-containing 3-like protein [Labeo rohita]
MASVKEMLMGSMKELVEAELKAFKWHLMNPSYKHIPRSELEKADIFDTVDKMIACFGPEEAVKVTVDILRKMNQNELAKQLENKHKQDIFDTVDKMIACFGPEEAVKVTVDILRKMNQNELAKQLENKHKQVHYTPVQMRDASTGVNVDMKAETGASVNAPVLTANTFTGPVTIYAPNSAGNGTFTSQ